MSSGSSDGLSSGSSDGLSSGSSDGRPGGDRSAAGAESGHGPTRRAGPREGETRPRPAAPRERTGSRQRPGSPAAISAGASDDPAERSEGRRAGHPAGVPERRAACAAGHVPGNTEQPGTERLIDDDRRCPTPRRLEEDHRDQVLGRGRIIGATGAEPVHLVGMPVEQRAENVRVAGPYGARTTSVGLPYPPPLTRIASASRGSRLSFCGVSAPHRTSPADNFITGRLNPGCLPPMEGTMGRRTLLLVAALVVAALGTTGVFLYVNGIDQRAEADYDLVEVLVATTPIAAGTTAQAAQDTASLDLRPFLRKSLEGLPALSDITGIADKVALAPIAVGEPILESQFGDPGQIDGLVAEHAELEQRLADPGVHADQALARRLNQRYAELTAVVRAYDEWRRSGTTSGRPASWAPRTRPSPRRPTQLDARRARGRGAAPPPAGAARRHRRQGRAPRDQVRRGRRGVRALRRRPAADVHPVRRAAGVATEQLDATPSDLGRLQVGHRRGARRRARRSPARRRTPCSSSRAACTACSGCRSPSRRGGSTPRRRACW